MGVIPALQCQPSLSSPQWIPMKIALNFSPSVNCQKIFEQPSPCVTVVTNYSRRRLGRRVVGFSPPPPMEDEQFEHMFEVARLSEIPTDPSPPTTTTPCRAAGDPCCSSSEAAAWKTVFIKMQMLHIRLFKPIKEAASRCKMHPSPRCVHGKALC